MYEVNAFAIADLLGATVFRQAPDWPRAHRPRLAIGNRLGLPMFAGYPGCGFTTCSQIGL